VSEKTDFHLPREKRAGAAEYGAPVSVQPAAFIQSQMWRD